MKVENLKPIKDILPGQKFRTILDDPKDVYIMRGRAPCPFPKNPDGYNTIQGTWLHADSMVWELTEEPDPVPDVLKNIKIVKHDSQTKEGQEEER